MQTLTDMVLVIPIYIRKTTLQNETSAEDETKPTQTLRIFSL